MRLNALQLEMLRTRMPRGSVVATAYGGGVNTMALLVLQRRLGVVPRVILMADPGDEWPETLEYRDNVAQPWLKSIGFPPVTVISRMSEGAHRPRAWQLQTLRQECEAKDMLPSQAYGFKKCSLKFKRDPQLWWFERQEWARELWATGERIIKAIGYDDDESHRIKPTFGDPQEAARYVPWYPLHDARLSREDCEALIADEGLPVPPGSSCWFCPNSSLDDWRRLRRDHPELFAEAVVMSRRAAPGLEQPGVVGLMRCNREGQRQLHEWADGLYGDTEACDILDLKPCECAL